MMKKNLGFLLIVLASFLYGCFGFLALKIVNDGSTMEEMLFWRFFLSALIILPFIFSQKLILKKMIISYFFCSITYAFSTWVYFIAVLKIGTGLSMVLFFTFPAIVCILNWIINKEKPSNNIILVLLIIFIGIYFISNSSLNNDLLGICCALLAGFGYGIYIFCSKNLGSSMLQTTFIICLNSSLFFLALSFKSSLYFFPKIPADWTYITMLSIACTIVPIFSLLWATRFISTIYIAILSVVEPITTLLISHFFLKEPINILQWGGVFAILLGFVSLNTRLFLAQDQSFVNEVKLKLGLISGRLTVNPLFFRRSGPTVMELKKSENKTLNPLQ